MTAKFSRGLIRKIYLHLIERGWLAPGMTVLDPFAGVALGARDALELGLHWVGCELEPKFVALGEQNIALWNHRLRGWAQRGTARIVQGDSRRLLEVLREAQVCMSSPPFGEAQKFGTAIVYKNGDRIQDRAYSPEQQGTTPGQLGNLPARESDFAAAVGSPLYADEKLNDSQRKAQDSAFKLRQPQTYSESESNLGNMPEGKLDSAITSPPYADISIIGGETSKVPIGKAPGRKKQQRLPSKGDYGYGNSPANLGNLPEGRFDASVTSPPYEALTTTADLRVDKNKWGTGRDLSMRAKAGRRNYGERPEQIGAMEGDTFWSAAKTIVAQTYAALKPGGVAAWVVKSFVRDGVLVDFPGQWRQLCEACDFVTVEEIRAWVVDENGLQLAFDDKPKRELTEHKSFFRRDHELKAKAKLYWSSLSEELRAEWLEQARIFLQAEYERMTAIGKKLLPPTPQRLLVRAQVAAYRYDRKPAIETEIIINHETVWVMRK